MPEFETKVFQKMPIMILFVLVLLNAFPFSVMGFEMGIMNLYLALQKRTPSWFPSLPLNVMADVVSRSTIELFLLGWKPFFLIIHLILYLIRQFSMDGPLRTQMTTTSLSHSATRLLCNMTSQYQRARNGTTKVSYIIDIHLINKLYILM